MTLLEAALRFLQAGKPVFPVDCETKRPLAEWKAFQQRLPTDQQIKAWWTHWPRANIGMATGGLSGVVVVDCDSEEATNRFIENYPEAKVTLQVQTGRGRHFLFQFEEGIRNDAGRVLGPGTDIRGDGGFVIIPPSVHANGRPYQWLNRVKPLPLPDNLKEILVNRNGNEQRYRERFDTARALAGVPEGQRDDTLFRLACKLRGADVPQDVAETLVLEAARNCQPPFSETEALEKVRNAYSRYPAGDGKPERQQPIAAVAEIEEEKKQVDNGSVPFPEVAWSGPFEQWRDNVAPCTEAALENLWAAFLVVVGLMLGRNVWRESPRPLYPNFYILLLGQTGDSRKSTVLWLAGELLKRIGEAVEILTGIVSTEGLFERLAKAEETRALGYVDELRSLLSVGRRKGTQDLLPKLNSLYYCPDKETIDRREKPTTVVRPFFSLMAATAQEYVEDLIGNLEVAGGTLNRFLIVSGEEQPPKAEVESPTPEAWERIAAPLREVRDRCKASPRRMVWSPEAKELWEEFYVQWRTVRKAWDARAANLTARTHEHVQKIALVYSALSGEGEVSARSLATAIAIGEWLEKTILRLFGDVGLDPFAKAEKTILEILKPKRRLWRRDLQQVASKKKINGKLFGEVLRSLEASDHVKQGKTESLSGQRRPFVEYIPGNTFPQAGQGKRCWVFPMYLKGESYEKPLRSSPKIPRCPTARDAGRPHPYS